MTAIAQQMVTPVVRDLGNVAETLVNGPINMSVTGDLVTLTFTTVRPEVQQMFSGQIKDSSAVVTCRLTMTFAMLTQLKDLLNKNVQVQPVAMGSLRQQ